MNMMMQSKFATYGEGVTTTRPVARYAPWVNPYHPLPDEEAYAAAWKASLSDEQRGRKKAEADHQRQYITSSVWMNVCAEAIAEGNVTTKEIAQFANCSLDHARRALRQLEQDGRARCEMHSAHKGGRVAHWIATEAAK